VAAILQIIASLFRQSNAMKKLPHSVINGMLAAIGVIIILKQIPVLLGSTTFKASAANFFLHLPALLADISRDEAIIGIAGIIVMFGFAYTARGWLKRVPPQILVLLLGILVADLEHLNRFPEGLIGKFFVRVPDHPLDLITFPDFSQVFSPVSLKHSIFLFLVCSVESLLTVTAVDGLDPKKRTSNLDRDLTATGISNLIASLIGGLPMISEIVRSRANIDNGARSATSNFVHGVFLLLSLLLIPHVLDQIPLACLAAMLIFTGTRLASITTFKNAYKSGMTHFIAFMITLLVTVFIDLLTGVILGCVFELCTALWMKKRRRYS
jgi:MFS superfamily sulfate permease-like transporter